MEVVCSEDVPTYVALKLILNDFEHAMDELYHFFKQSGHPTSIDNKMFFSYVDFTSNGCIFCKTKMKQ